MVTGSEVRAGMVLKLGEDIFRVIIADYHAGGGKMGGVMHAKLRQLKTGTVREQRFRADEPVEPLELERYAMQFLYADESDYHFMNPQNFEQVAVAAEILGAGRAYLTEGLTLPVELLDGEPVGVIFPEQVEIRVEETAPPFHAQTGEHVWKEARLENGVSILVPPFIAAGERIRVDVDSGKYVGRVKEEKKK